MNTIFTVYGRGVVRQELPDGTFLIVLRDGGSCVLHASEIFSPRKNVTAEIARERPIRVAPPGRN